MIGYMFVYGVDGFGADVAPAPEEGVYTDFDKAFARQCELNTDFEEGDYPFYEAGYGEDYYPESNTILAKADRDGDWDTYEAELAKHKLSTVEEVCKMINKQDEPPFSYYQLVEVEIY